MNKFLKIFLICGLLSVQANSLRSESFLQKAANKCFYLDLILPTFFSLYNAKKAIECYNPELNQTQTKQYIIPQNAVLPHLKWSFIGLEVAICNTLAHCASGSSLNFVKKNPRTSIACVICLLMQII